MPVIVEFNPLLMQQLYHLIYHPSKVKKDRPGTWINWVFSLKQPEQRYLLEFVEGWSPLRITIATSLPLFASVVTGIVWSVLAKDVSTAFTIASYILGFGSGEFVSQWWRLQIESAGLLISYTTTKLLSLF